MKAYDLTQIVSQKVTHISSIKLEGKYVSIRTKISSTNKNLSELTTIRIVIDSDLIQGLCHTGKGSKQAMGLHKDLALHP